MDLQKYTQKAQEALVEAQNIAQKYGNQQLEAEHLLKALLSKKDGVISSLLHRLNININNLNLKLDQRLQNLPKISGTNVSLYLSPSLQKILLFAQNLSEKSKDQFITVERLLQALLMENSAPTSKMLKDFGLDAVSLNEVINEMRQGHNADNVYAEDQYEALKKYTQNLTQTAQDGKLDPVIGRDEEIRRAIQVLARRTKNNPVLIGEPGVGKTAIVEGLALRIVNGDVPETLKDRSLYVLDLGAMIAGAKFRGEFEERLKSLLNEVKASSNQIILFIDEMHMLMGAGKTEGAMDASNLLKPALARGEIHCIGATTLDEYRQYVEKDAAFARRFQPIYVNEPSIEDSIAILRGIKEKYEQHHKVRLSDSALVNAVTLSNRYLTDRFLPDKAIDLIDEAASRLRMQVDSKPEELDELDRRILQLKIEREALKKESDNASKNRLKELEVELNDLEEKSSSLNKRWQSEKEKLGRAAELKKRLEEARNSLSLAQRQGEYQRAGELSYSIIPELEKELVQAEEYETTQNSMIEEVVTPNHIAQIVSRWTGVPVDRMLEGEREKLLQMEEILNQRVVGQTDAIKSISRAIRRSRAGVQDPHRPIGSFMFLGPTGVGKTELAKSLAHFLFQSSHSMIRIDMSEYMEKHSVARLIGAPPGYVGYEEGGVLTEAVRRRPYQILLFDEIEKAHPDVFNILLQVLDDGRLTDSQGRTVDFRNTVIIMTSNLGAQYLSDLKENEETDIVKDQVLNVVRQAFRPEFLNRIDEIILFHRLKRKEMDAIVDIQLQNLQNLVKDHKWVLRIDQDAKKWLANKGYDPLYGARPLKRVLQKYIQDPLADYILSGDIEDDCVIHISKKENGLFFSSEKKQ